MRRLPTIVLPLLLPALMAPGCRGEEGERPAAPLRTQPLWEGTIVALGDSLTAGYGLDEKEAYPFLLERKLAAAGIPWRVVNAGVSGETSSGTLARADWILERLDPDIVILETGANDGLRGIDTGLVKANIAAAVTKLQQGGATVVIAGMQMVRNLGDDYTGTFAALYREVASETGAALIPFFLEGVAAEPSLNQTDGIHPTAEGYRIVVETVYPYVLDAIVRSKD